MPESQGIGRDVFLLIILHELSLIKHTLSSGHSIILSQVLQTQAGMPRAMVRTVLLLCINQHAPSGYDLLF